MIHLDTEEGSTRPEQAMQSDSVLKSLSPLINSMRLFGLYFTRKPRVGPNCEGTIKQRRQRVRRHQGWNFARVHATVILVVAFLNAIRFATCFDGKETLGAVLLMKLGLIASALLNIVSQTAYYIASHTGSLDRVLRQVNLSTKELSWKYIRRVKVVTVVCWLLWTWNIIFYTHQLFTNGRLNDLAVILLHRTLPAELYHYVVKAVLIVLQVQTVGSCLFPLAMNYMVLALLYDQYRLLNSEFSKCISDRGDFSSNFEQFRQRHQAITCTVQEADRFLMISNGTNISCNIASIVLGLYSSIFYRNDTIFFDPQSAIIYAAWLSLSVFGLLLAAGQAIILNHVAHNLGERVHHINLETLDIKTAVEINIFLNRLNAEPIGVSVLGIFVVDKNTILAVLGLLVTYFLLVVQFASPSTCTSATSAGPTNNTTAAFY